MPNAPTDRTRCVAAGAALTGGVCVLAFWLVYFASSATLGRGDPTVHAFESAFLVADAAFAILLVAAGLALFRRRPAGPFLLVAAAAMSLYLALLDLTFYSRQGLYAADTGSMLELAVNALCLGGGLLGLRCGWTLWIARAA
jgi:hypothetical protein